MSKQIKVSTDNDSILFEITDYLVNGKNNSGFNKWGKLDIKSNISDNYKTAKSNLSKIVNRKLHNGAIGLDVSISGNSARELANGYSPEDTDLVKAHIVALSNIRQLYETSIPFMIRTGGETDNKRKDSEIKYIYRLMNGFYVDGNPYVCSMLVKEFTKDSYGNRLYHIREVEIEKADTITAPTPHDEGGEILYRLSNQRITDFIESVKKGTYDTFDLTEEEREKFNSG